MSNNTNSTHENLSLINFQLSLLQELALDPKEGYLHLSKDATSGFYFVLEAVRETIQAELHKLERNG